LAQVLSRSAELQKVMACSFQQATSLVKRKKNLPKKGTQLE